MRSGSFREGRGDAVAGVHDTLDRIARARADLRASTRTARAAHLRTLARLGSRLHVQAAAGARALDTGVEGGR